MKTLAISVILLLTGVLSAYWLTAAERNPNTDLVWEQLIIPGALSEAHAFLNDDCHSCHEVLSGVERQNCVLCHANETSVLGRQPTAFHAEVSDCVGCHREHQGRDANLNTMDHAFLAETLFESLRRNVNLNENSPIFSYVDIIGQHLNTSLANRDITAESYALDCAGCHSTKDPHFNYMGNDCVQCHNLESWTIAEFRHPTASSTDCVQCHQPPPSHMMEHFTMLSQPVARERNAPVENCFTCHQTTSWNDIKKIGFYKHH